MYFSSTHDLREHPDFQKNYRDVSDELDNALKKQDFLEPDGNYGERLSLVFRFWTPTDAIDKYKRYNCRYDNKRQTLGLEYFLPTIEYTPLNKVEFRQKFSRDCLPYLHRSLQKYKKQGKISSLDVDGFMAKLIAQLRECGEGWRSSC